MTLLDLGLEKKDVFVAKSGAISEGRLPIAHHDWAISEGMVGINTQIHWAQSEAKGDWF